MTKCKREWVFLPPRATKIYMTESFRHNLQIIFIYEIHKLCGSWRRQEAAMCGVFLSFIQSIQNEALFSFQFQLMYLSFLCLSNQWQMGRMFKKINQPKEKHFYMKKGKKKNCKATLVIVWTSGVPIDDSQSYWR